MNSLPTALACGPSYISPVFEYEYAPENPFQNYASGKLGVIKPTQRRVVLFAAYRYLSGGGFSADEQKGLIEVWNAEFNNKDFSDDSVDEAVKNWVEARKNVFPKEEKLPEIYTERSYGGYDFFPNCTKNAFETATKTLKDRVSSYGADNKDVKNWLTGQDKVFTNCSIGRQIPDAADASMPEWLQKDRAYQLAAADFYSLHYDEAKNRFALIAVATDSPWQETAEYLVGRTLIRQASSVKDEARKSLLYTEAEQQLQIAASRSGKFADSAKKMLGLVKYRLRPQERVRELARDLTYQSADENFRQDLIDYSWLLDKFEKESLEAEEQRKKEAEAKENLANSNSSISENSNISEETKSDPNDTRLTIYFGNEDYSKSYTIKIAPEATDDEAITEAEKVAGTLTDKMKQSIREARQSAYAGRFTENTDSAYQGGYWGETEKSLSVLSQFLRQDDLSDWLFTYQIQNQEAYLYSLQKYKQNRSDLWLMTAISKADASSSDLNYLLESAKKTSPNSPAFQTIAYHQARILLLQNKNAEAKKLLDSVLNSSLELTTSARNQFLELRVKIAENLDEYLKYSQLKPFAFDFDGESMTIEEIIALQKSYYNPEYDKQTKEEYDREIDEQYKDQLAWDDRLMFNYQTTASINEYFPLSLLIETEKSPALPDYLRERFAMAIFTRALISGDFVTASKIEPEILKFKPEFSDQINEYKNAKTPAAKRDAVLYFILKNPILTPFIEDGLGRTDNEVGSFDADDWWCAPYISEDESTEDAQYKPKKPSFITEAQIKTAKIERQKLVDLGDAPKYLGDKVIAWQKRAPLDKRIPESLYIVYQANGWTKYGCGNNEELKNTARDLLIKRYPKNEWTGKLLDEERENQ
jgi:hypothetical protein